MVITAYFPGSKQVKNHHEYGYLSLPCRWSSSFSFIGMTAFRGPEVQDWKEIDQQVPTTHPEGGIPTHDLRGDY